MASKVKNPTKPANVPNGYVNNDRNQEQYDHYQSSNHNASNPRALHVKVHVNNDKFEPGKKMTVQVNKIKTFENFLEECTEKIKPPFGAARRLYTARGRRRIDRLEDLEEDNIYVITGNEAFKKHNYREIPEKQRHPRAKGFKKIDITRIYQPVQHAIEERLRKKSGRSYYLNEHRRGLRLRVHINGYNERAVVPVSILYKNKDNWEKILEEIEKTLSITPIERVYKVINQGGVTENFQEVSSPEHLDPDDHLLVLPRGDKHLSPNYYPIDGKNNFKVKTSPRAGQYYLYPSFPMDNQNHPQYKHNKSLNKHRPLPSIGSSSKQSQAMSPFSNQGSQGGRPTPISRRSKPPSTKKGHVKQVDYDQDQGGVYKAKGSRNARGAQQVNETRDTRTERPIDQREAETVEEEDFPAKEKNAPIPPGTELNKQPSKESKEDLVQPGKGKEVIETNSKDPFKKPSPLPPIAGKQSDLDASGSKVGVGKEDNEDVINDGDSLNKDTDKSGIMPKRAGEITEGQVRENVDKFESMGSGQSANQNGLNGQSPYPVDDKERETPAELNFADFRESPAGKNGARSVLSNQPPLSTTPAMGNQSVMSNMKDHSVEDAGMRNGDFDDNSFDQFDRNEYAGQNKDPHTSTPESRGRVRTPESRGETRNKQEQRENEAATKIQAGFKGHKARKEYQKKKEAAKAKQPPPAQNSKPQKSGGAGGMNQDQAASKIQAGFKGYKVRKDLNVKKQQVRDVRDKQEREAATTIQSGFKGYKARKEYRSMKDKKQAQFQREPSKGTDINDNEKKVNDEARNVAAVKIQANYRGYKTRKSLANKNQDKSVPDTKSSKKGMSNDEAASKIQAGFKGFKTRKDLASKQVEKSVDKKTDKRMTDNEAATKIQANYKGYKTRKDLADKKTKQPETPDKNKTDNDKEKSAAATSIQANFKGFKARKEYDALKQKKQKEDKAATKIQSSYRGYRTRKDLAKKKVDPQLPDQAPTPKSDNDKERDRAATKIQSNYRGYRARKAYQAQVIGDEIVETDPAQLPESEHTKLSSKQSQFIDRPRGQAASVIQSAFRSLQNKKSLKPRAYPFDTDDSSVDELPESDEKVIATFRGFIARKANADLMQRKNLAAMKIQSSFRGYKVRQKKFYSLRSVECFHAAVRGYVTRQLNAIPTESEVSVLSVANGDFYASVIQALCMGFLTRHSVQQGTFVSKSKPKSAISLQGPTSSNDLSSPRKTDQVSSFWEDTNVRMFSDKTIRKSAARIQAAAYAFKIRTKYKQLRKGQGRFVSQTLHSETDTASAINLQACFKGFKFRLLASEESDRKMDESVQKIDKYVREERDKTIIDEGEGGSMENSISVSVKHMSDKLESNQNIEEDLDGNDKIKSSGTKEGAVKGLPRLNGSANSLKSGVLNLSEFERDSISRTDSRSTWLSVEKVKAPGDVEREGDSYREVEDDADELKSIEKNVNAVSHLQAAFRGYQLRRELEREMSELSGGGHELMDMEKIRREVSALRKDFRLRSHRRRGLGKHFRKGKSPDWWDSNDEAKDDDDDDMTETIEKKFNAAGSQEDNESIDKRYRVESASKIKAAMSGYLVRKKSAKEQVQSERKEHAKLKIEAAFRGYRTRKTEQMIQSAQRGKSSLSTHSRNSSARGSGRKRKRPLSSSTKSRVKSAKSRSGSAGKNGKRFHVLMHSDVLNDRSTKLQAAFAGYQARKVFMSLSKMAHSGPNSSDHQLERMGSMSETDDFKLRHKSIAKIHAAFESNRMNNDTRRLPGTFLFPKASSMGGLSDLNRHYVLPPIGQHARRPEDLGRRPRSGISVRSYTSSLSDGKSKTQPDLYRRAENMNDTQKLNGIEIYIKKKLASTLIQSYVKGWMVRQTYKTVTHSQQSNKPDTVKTKVSSPKPSTSQNNDTKVVKSKVDKDDRKSPLSSSSKGSKVANRIKPISPENKDSHKSSKDEMVELVRVRTASVKLEAERRKVFAEQLRLKEANEAKEATSNVKKQAEKLKAAKSATSRVDSPSRLSPIPSSRVQTSRDPENSKTDKNQAAVKIQKVYRGYRARNTLVKRQKTKVELENEYKDWKTKRIEAAVAIQSAWKGYSVRKELADQSEALANGFGSFDNDDEPTGLLIINIGRSKSEIERANRRYDNASMIQMVYRACQIRRSMVIKAAVGRRRKNKAACVIQALYRGYLTRKSMKCTYSASRIQSVGKGYLARVRNEERKRELEIKQNKAASLLQAAYISFKRRRQNDAEKEDRRMNRAAVDIQTSIRAFIVRWELNKRKEMIQKEAAEKLQASFRGRSVRLQMKAREEAVKVILAGYRSYLARQEVQAYKEKLERERQAASRIQAAYKAYLTRTKNTEYKAKVARETKAATKIQCSMKGMKVRKEYKRMKEETARKREVSALKIQSFFRGYLARNEAQARRREKAALKIQSVFRGHLARKEAIAKRRERAAIQIQATYRGHLGRRVARKELRARQKQRAASLIQAVYRGHNRREIIKKDRHVQTVHQIALDTIDTIITRAFNYCKKRSDSAERIQATVKGYSTRRMMASKLSDDEKIKMKERHVTATMVQAVVRAKQERRRQGQQRLLKEQQNAAVKIQSQWRGHRTRMAMKEEKERIANIEAPTTALISARTLSGKLLQISVDDVLLKNSRAIIVFHKKATELQGAFRARQTRKEMHNRLMRKSQITNYTPRRPQSAPKTLSGEDVAAILIQKTFRGYRDRKLYRNAIARKKKVLNKAASVIQAAWWGYSTRYLSRNKWAKYESERVKDVFRMKYEAANTIACAYRSFAHRRHKKSLRAEM